MVDGEKESEQEESRVPLDRTQSTRGESLYLQLGIPKDADEKAIKKAYRKLALRYHPDKNPDNPEAEAIFKDINFANTILMDEKKRKIYDEYGLRGVEMFEQFGEDDALMYCAMAHPCCKLLFCFLFCITGCCFGCFCFCCCCGLCKPANPDEEAGQGQEPVVEQPGQQAPMAMPMPMPAGDGGTSGSTPIAMPMAAPMPAPAPSSAAAEKEGDIPLGDGGDAAPAQPPPSYDDLEQSV